jgi:hypothetical protein
MSAVISIDLFDAARRSDDFPKDWSEDHIRAAIDRYERFLSLVARHPGVALAPTREIDAVWHLHMLRPRAYYDDCQRLFGYLLDHDGGFGKEPEELPVLQRTFMRTAKLWEEAYGEQYVPAAEGDALEKCWHNCQSRCWHACKSQVEVSAAV